MKHGDKNIVNYGSGNIFTDIKGNIIINNVANKQDIDMEELSKQLEILLEKYHLQTDYDETEQEKIYEAKILAEKKDVNQCLRKIEKFSFPMLKLAKALALELIVEIIKNSVKQI